MLKSIQDCYKESWEGIKIDDIIYKLLEDIPNVYAGWYREELSETHVTFMKYYYSPSTFLDDEATEIYFAYQFDVWGTDKDEVESIEKQVRKILIKNDFEWLDGKGEFETETGLYHNSNRFNTNIEIESEES